MKRKAEPRHPQRSAGRGGGLRKVSKNSDLLEVPPAYEPLNDSPEESEVDTDDENQRDPSMYDSLLSSLKSSCGSFAHVYDKRQREQEGVSSAEEDDQDTGLESESDDSIDDEVEVGTEPLESSDKKIVESEEDQDIEGTVSTDDEDDVEDDDEDRENNEASVSISSFKLHTTYTLAEADVQKLKEGKIKFKSEFPAHGMPMRKWTTNNDSLQKEDARLASYGVQSRLQKHWQSIHKKSDCGDFTSAKQSQFFSLCNSYQDILHSNKNSFLCGGQDDDSSIMDAYLLHILNHIYKTRDLVTKNSARLNQQAERKDKTTDVTELSRDQGFTRPKVLIVLPLRSIALRTVKSLIDLIPPSCKVSIEYKDRFFDEFGNGEDEDNETLKEGLTSEGQQKGKSQISSKPADFQALFGGNNDDHFRIGIKITKKSVKLYSDFYSSDIIVASPIGLITKIGEAESEKNKDVDFLSSIEILVIDHADVILMQNWSHVISVIDQLNMIPTKQHGTDFMRIREWYLNGHARYYRQTILLSNFVNAEINALFNRSCLNYRGKVKLLSLYSGVLPKVVLQVRQVYERFDCRSALDVDDQRFDFFVKKVFPKIKDSLQGGIMVFLSSYFDFVRLRNYMKSQDTSFCLVGEYTKQSDISRGRTWFFHGKRKIMLYTERAHFYHRYKIRGIRDLIFYSLPERNDFYAELTNMFEGVDNPTCTVLFSRFDSLRLERIVGSSSAKKMLNSNKQTFMFC